MDETKSDETKDTQSEIQHDGIMKEIRHEENRHSDRMVQLLERLDHLQGELNKELQHLRDTASGITKDIKSLSESIKEVNEQRR